MRRRASYAIHDFSGTALLLFVPDNPFRAKDLLEPRPGQEWFWSEAWQTAEREVEADLAAGKYETFETMEDFLKDLK